MKFRIASDLHTEFWNCNGEKKLRSCVDFALPPAEEDKDAVLLLAGDTFSMESSWKVEPVFKHLSERFHAVVGVIGNHEPWGSMYKDAVYFYEDAAAALPNVTYSETVRKDFDGVYVVGATLWTDFNKCNPVDMMVAKDYMRDYSRIGGFTPEIAYHKHITHRAFIKDNADKESIVMTHHSPSFRSTHPRFKGESANCFYSSDMEDFIEDISPVVWVHGHIHHRSEYNIGTTRVICNPHGYKGHERPGFDRKLFIELTTEKEYNMSYFTGFIPEEKK